MAELNTTLVLLVGFSGMIIGFIGVIGTTAGLVIWLDRKQTARIDALREDMREMRDDMREMRDDMREMQRNIQVLSSKVDRAQGNLDVLVFGERGVPPPVARERAETERQAAETVGD